MYAREVGEQRPVNYNDLPQERVIPQHRSSFYHTLCQDSERQFLLMAERNNITRASERFIQDYE